MNYNLETLLGYLLEDETAKRGDLFKNGVVGRKYGIYNDLFKNW